MKRYIAVILSILIAAIIVSCGPASDLPSNKFIDAKAMSTDFNLKSNVQKIADQMLQIADDYLDLKCSAAEAQDRCKELKNRMSTMSDVAIDDYRYENPNYYVLGYISRISDAITKAEDDSIVEQNRDMLSHYLNKPQRRDSYAADKDFWNYLADEDEKKLFEELHISATDFSDCSISKYSKEAIITIRYNTVNAVRIGDFVSYAEKLVNAMTKISDISEYDIQLYLDYYEYSNEVACIEIDNHDGAQRIRAFSYTDEQYIEFDSFDAVRSALEG